MRINVYSQELTSEVIHVQKESNTGVVYHAAQLILHSSAKLHHLRWTTTAAPCFSACVRSFGVLTGISL